MDYGVPWHVQWRYFATLLRSRNNKPYFLNTAACLSWSARFFVTLSTSCEERINSLLFLYAFAQPLCFLPNRHLLSILLHPDFSDVHRLLRVLLHVELLQYCQARQHHW